MSSIDEIIERYKRDVDLTLIDAALRRMAGRPKDLEAIAELESLRDRLERCPMRSPVLSAGTQS
jgi:hypothetical protein